MHSSGSFIKTVLERCRSYVDEPDFDAKYNNDFIVRHWILPSLTDVLSRVNSTQDNPIVIRHAISVVDGTEYYVLPPAMQEIWRLSQHDDEMRLTGDFRPRSNMNPCGEGWALEGNTIRFTPLPQGNATWHLWYVPNGSVGPHYADGTTSDSKAVMTPGSGGIAFTLANTPTLGIKDRRENAYEGQIFRYLSTASGAEWQERIIETYDYTSNTITLRNAVTGDDLSDGFAYEIAPPLHYSLWEAIACRTAIKMGVARRLSVQHRAAIRDEYLSAIKTVRDQYSNFNLRASKFFRKDTLDNDPTSV